MTTTTAAHSPYGEVIAPLTLRIERILPGPIERVWAYLTESDMRKRWLASGKMALKVGAPFALTWRNDELTSPSGTRPEGFSDEHTMASRVTAVDPHRTLAFTWGDDGEGEVTITLEEVGPEVRLTLVHRRLKPAQVPYVATGWHLHLDVLAEDLAGTPKSPFWDRWAATFPIYRARLAAA